MATVTGYTAERMKQIEDSSIVSGIIVGNNLILTRYDSTQVDAGNVRGPQGIQGPIGATTIPAGAIMMWTTLTPPAGWLLANGIAVSRTTYSVLFTAIGTSYGTGDGSTTFNIPNLTARVPVGYDASTIDFNAVGKTGGEAKHILLPNEMPSHNHAIDPPNTVTDTQGNHQHTSVDGGNIVTTAATNFAGLSVSAGGNPSSPYTSFAGNHAHNLDIPSFNSGTAGSSLSHNNLQPYLTLPFIVKT